MSWLHDYIKMLNDVNFIKKAQQIHKQTILDYIIILNLHQIPTTDSQEHKHSKKLHIKKNKEPKNIINLKHNHLSHNKIKLHI